MKALVVGGASGLGRHGPRDRAASGRRRRAHEREGERSGQRHAGHDPHDPHNHRPHPPVFPPPLGATQRLPAPGPACPPSARARQGNQTPPPHAPRAAERGAGEAYPGVAATVRQDVQNIKALLRVFTAIARDVMRQDVDRDEVAAELEARLHEELDYRREAANLVRFGRLLTDDPEVRVPRVHRSLSTGRVLTMEFLDGYPIQDIMAPGVDQALKDGDLDADEAAELKKEIEAADFPGYSGGRGFGLGHRGGFGGPGGKHGFRP